MIRYIAPSGLRNVLESCTQHSASLHVGLRVHCPFGTKFRGSNLTASAVLEAGKALWPAYFAHTDVHTVREELKLNRADVGWYQIRKALQSRNESGDFPPVSFKPFESAYKALTEKLQPMVYELGFLKG